MPILYTPVYPYFNIKPTQLTQQPHRTQLFNPIPHKPQALTADGSLIIDFVMIPGGHYLVHTQAHTGAQLDYSFGCTHLYGSVFRYVCVG